jgi:hypothetical protein
LRNQSAAVMTPGLASMPPRADGTSGP